MNERRRRNKEGRGKATETANVERSLYCEEEEEKEDNRSASQ